MTKKQVLYSLRERIAHVREVCSLELAKSAKLSEDCSYHRGRIDAYDLVFEMLSDYD